jgi:NAD dependent epimerase/dehydratase family enzyme
MDIFIFCIRNLKIEGVINVVSPSLTKINRFYKVLARVKNRRILLWFNSRFLKLAMGESADLLTRGQRVLPEKLEKEGFNFRYGNIEDALNKACN